jgi:hypothetical protein
MRSTDEPAISSAADDHALIRSLEYDDPELYAGLLGRTAGERRAGLRIDGVEFHVLARLIRSCNRPRFRPHILTRRCKSLAKSHAKAGQIAPGLASGQHWRGTTRLVDDFTDRVRRAGLAGAFGE